MPVSPLAFRTPTFVAAGFLALDGAALAGVGIWAGSSRLLLAGAGLLIASALVLVFWRRHLRRLQEIADVRRELRGEADELRRILRG